MEMMVVVMMVVVVMVVVMNLAVVTEVMIEVVNKRPYHYELYWV
jgi:hypothetical protein